MGALIAPGRTGVRIAGDDYQWRHVWRACLGMLHDVATGAANPVVSVGVETDGDGNVDDVVLRRRRPPHRYTQVKYTVGWSTPLGLTYLSAKKKATSTSVLERLVASYRSLVERGEPFEMSVLTNRAPDPDDILIAGRDSRTGLLLPHAADGGPGSKRGLARKAWAEAAGMSVDELLRMLDVLEFVSSIEIKELDETISLAMTAVGLRSDPVSVQAGADWVASQVRDGKRGLSVADVNAGIDELGLHAGRVWTTVSIATLKPDPLAGQAAASLDWVDRFDGEDAYSRRQPRPPATWEELAADLTALEGQLGGRGRDGVLVTGSLRQATGFAVGAAFRKVNGFDIAVRQGPQLWHSEVAYDGPATPTMSEPEVLGLGDGLAVVVQVARPAVDDVRDWITSTSLPVRTLVALSPPSGKVYDQSIPDAATALAFAVGVRDTVGRLAKKHDRVHLFLAGPLGLAVLIGQRWNRVKDTTVYEDLGDDQYVPALHITA